MSVDVKFNVESSGDGRYEDGEGREYRYVVNDNGTLSIFEKEVGESLSKQEPPIAIYGAAAWFSVTGDPRTAADGPSPKVHVF